MTSARILIIEDELIVAQNLQHWLSGLNYTVSGIAASGEEAITLALADPPDLMLVDIRLSGDMDGVQTAEQIQSHLDVPVIYLTAYADETILQRARKTGPFGYMIKPFELRELRITVEMALYKHAMDQRLKANERWLSTILHSIGESVIACNTDQQITFMNQAAAALTGWNITEVQGQSIARVVRILAEDTHMPIEEPLKQALIAGVPTPPRQIVLLVRRDDTMIPVDASVTPIKDEQNRVLGGVLVLRDMTERRMIERKLLETQKLESLGVLAAGIAHDFNNFLSIILGNASLALLDIAEDSPFYPLIVPIEQTARRAAELTNQMLAYTGKGRIEFRALNLNLLLQQMNALVQTSLPRRVCLEYQYAPQLPDILADPIQIRQLILNLVVNASEAFGNSDGRINIATGQCYADTAYLSNAYLFPDIPPGNYVYIEVSDDGRGIDPVLIPRIFDPFFTTKFVGRGMGLSAALGIVRSHRGAMRLESASGQGTIVTALFPVIDEVAHTLVFEHEEIGIESFTTMATDERPPSIPSRSVSVAPEVNPAQGAVLVIDSEVEVCHLIGRSLEHLGYSVLTAIDLLDGIHLLQDDTGQIGCILFDLNVLRHHGEQAVQTLYDTRAHIPLILMSRQNRERATMHLCADNITGFLRKPFTTDDLYAIVQQVFNDHA